MLVFGASRFANAPSSYLRVVLIGHWILTVPLALAALAFGLGLRFLGAEAVSPVLLGLALAAPLYLLLMLLRRSFYLRMEPRESAIGSGVYLVFSLLGVFLLYRAGILSSASGFVALAAGGLVSSVWLLPRLDTGWLMPSRAELSEVFSVHWGFSRWTLGAQLAQWVRGNLYYLILPAWGGLEAAAALRALANVIMPITQPLTAIGPLLLPVFARMRARADFGVRVGWIGLLLASGAIVYWVILGSFAEPILRWLYAGKYAEYALLAWVIGLIPIFSAVASVVAAALRALERPDSDFWAHAVSALIALTAGVVLARNWGVAGALSGWTLSFLVTAALMTVILVSLRRREGASKRTRP